MKKGEFKEIFFLDICPAETDFLFQTMNEKKCENTDCDKNCKIKLFLDKIVIYEIFCSALCGIKTVQGVI